MAKLTKFVAKMTNTRPAPQSKLACSSTLEYKAPLSMV